jgi:AhpD family alkylhydroperoxidase
MQGGDRPPSAREEEISMSESMYPQATKALAQRRSELAPEIEAAFRQFSQAVFGDGALPVKSKQLIAVAVAHVTQCPYCIKGHTKAALRHGATPEELMEAIWVAAEMRAGGAYAHSALAIEEMENVPTANSA